MASKQSAAVVTYWPWSTVPAVDHERTTDDWDAIAHPADWSRPGLAA